MHRVAKIKEIADVKKQTTPKKASKPTGGTKRGANGTSKGQASPEGGDDEEELDLTPVKKVKAEDGKVKTDDEDS